MEQWDNRWEHIYTTQEWGKYPGESLIRFVARNFYARDRKTVKILEVGCGTGANIWYISREGFQAAYGIDGSNAAIQKATSRLQAEGLSADLRVGDIISLPYENDFFDAVIDNECLYCNTLPKTEMILGEIKRVLKTGGLLYSRTFSDTIDVGKNFPAGKLEFTEIDAGPFKGKGFVRLIDKKTIENLYGKFFTIISVDTLEETHYNGSLTINEWIIVCQK